MHPASRSRHMVLHNPVAWSRQIPANESSATWDVHSDLLSAETGKAAGDRPGSDEKTCATGVSLLSCQLVSAIDFMFPWPLHEYWFWRPIAHRGVRIGEAKTPDR